MQYWAHTNRDANLHIFRKLKNTLKMANELGLKKNDEEEIELTISRITRPKLSLWNKIVKTDDPEYHLVLSVKQDPVRELIMNIGTFEAQAIAIALEKLIPSRPLIQDYLQNVLKCLGIR